jgi:hypothetical protein
VKKGGKTGGTVILGREGEGGGGGGGGLRDANVCRQEG